MADLLRPQAVVSPDPLRGVDPEAFAYVARYWHVAPRLWLILRDYPDVPSVVRETLRAEYWRNVETNAGLRSAACDLFGALNTQGVIPMLLKGGCQLFDPPAGHAGTRFMVDLDVLAPPGQDRLSYETLCRLGFVPAAGSDPNQTHHWPKLTRPDDGLAVEVHRTPWVGGGAAEAEAFFASSVPIAGVEARVPSAAHRLLHNAIHIYQGPFGFCAVWDAFDLDQAIGCVDLRQLLDFVELCAYRDHELDWSAILAEADRFGHTPDLRQWSWVARELCAAPVPDEIATWDVEWPQTRRFRARCWVAAKAALHRARLLGPYRRLRSRWLS
jgi:hypothetical protein